MAAEGVFPKISGDCAYATEWNCMYAGGSQGASYAGLTLENAMNITRLQYCDGVTDIPHDYMVVDSMTDSTGYNNTVSCTPGYSNAPTIVCTCACGKGNNIGNYYAVTSLSGGLPCVPACIIAYACFAPQVTFSTITSICYCLYCNLSAYFVCDECPRTAIVQLTLSCSHDDYPTCCICCVFGGGAVPAPWLATTNCYCYVCLSANCWCFYKNGAGVCQVTMSSFPCLKIDAYAAIGDYSKSSPEACAGVFMCGFCYCAPVVTTSTWCCPTGCSALCGNYTNNTVTINKVLCGYKINGTTCGGNAVGNYYSTLCALFTNIGTNGTWTYCACICANDLGDLCNYSAICLCTYVYICLETYGLGSPCSTNCITFESISGTCTYCCCLTGTNQCTCVTHIDCFCFIRTPGTCDWNVYKNGSCICGKTNWNSWDYPLCSFQTLHNSSCSVSGTLMGETCVGVHNLTTELWEEKKVITVPICYTGAAKTVYADKYKTGNGTVVYNVIDANTGCCLCTNLCFNCLYTMSCCVCCHIYQFIQCCNCNSSIYSYAVAVSV